MYNSIINFTLKCKRIVSVSPTAEEILLEPQDVIEEALSHPHAEDSAAVRRHPHQKEKSKKCTSGLERKSIMDEPQSEIVSGKLDCPG